MRHHPPELRTVAFAMLALCLGACGGTTGGSPTGDGSSLVLTFPDAGHDAMTTPTEAGGPDVTTDAGQDAADVLAPPTDAQLNTYPSFLPNAPQVVNLGGLVYKSPTFIPVYFAGDPFAAEIPTFVSAVATSQYWTGAVGEYGVGAAVAGEAIVLDETLPASMTDAQIQVWLTNRIGTDPRFGAIPGTSVFDAGPFDAGPVDASDPVSDAIAPHLLMPNDAIYILFFPSGTSVTYGPGTSCSSFGGYHGSFSYPADNSTVAYAVIPRCGSFGAQTGFQAITATTSHELAEAATDPVAVNPAYAQVDDNHLLWASVLGGGELGDLCAQSAGAFYQPTEAALSKYTVQRIWSNKAAAAGHDPCAPALPTSLEPYYFNTVPNFGTVAISYRGQQFSTLARSVPVGTTSTIELDLFSDAPTGGQQWQITLIDANTYISGAAADLTFSPAVSYGTNGFKVQVDVTNSGSDGRTVHPFVIQSTLGASQNLWIGVITN